MLKNFIKKSLLLLIIISLSHLVFSQTADSTKVPGYFGGAVTITNKGISMVPNLSLGKPAAIFDLSMGKRKLSFEPSLRFALEGKPWSFLFWWRYKLLQTDKFRINLGAHPALSFKTYSFLIDGVTEEHMVVRRYLAGELAPSYFLNKDISIGTYLLYSYGIEKELTKNNTMISVRGSFSNIRISDQLYMRFNAQVYYLNMDNIDGSYINSTLTFARRNFPVSVSAMINQPIKTNIAAGNEFLWNVSLTYSFNKEYLEK
ncbi:MAG: hypothetical protein NTW82_10950 [Bacteroidia bacterium]|nr:hypothetical protein [Bacteroidia bacterium]